MTPAIRRMILKNKNTHNRSIRHRIIKEKRERDLKFKLREKTTRKSGIKTPTVDDFRKIHSEKTIKEICKLFNISILKELKKYKNNKLKELNKKDIIKLTEYLNKK